MSDLHPPEAQVNGGGAPLLSAPPQAENLGTKRQRRPSVRLGDIGGDQSFDSHPNRRIKQWKLPMKDSSKGSKIRNLTNLAVGGGGGGEYHETLDGGGGDEREGNLDAVAIGSWRGKESSKAKRGLTTKRVRSSWGLKVDDGGGISGEGEDVDDGFRDFDSESPMKEQSPNLDNLADDEDENRGGQEREVNFSRRGGGGGFTRVSEGRENNDGIELEGPSDADERNWNNGGERNGVRVWLNQLGLGRYAPVFEIHEVDDEVLPLLTLEDLKDMGINAVGSRRKMYCAIQKLSKGFS